MDELIDSVDCKNFLGFSVKASTVFDSLMRQQATNIGRQINYKQLVV